MWTRNKAALMGEAARVRAERRVASRSPIRASSTRGERHPEIVFARKLA
jgi:hypothetical protein